MVCDSVYEVLQPVPRSLNPCFNGIWSATPTQKAKLFSMTVVLILVLMEYGLRRRLWILLAILNYVLILVLMEYGLRLVCKDVIGRDVVVLILVLMEYGLRLYPLPVFNILVVVLILVLMEYGLRLRLCA